MTTPTSGKQDQNPTGLPSVTPSSEAIRATDSRDDLAHELWAAAQLLPNEGIEDGVDRIAALLKSSAGAGEQPIAPESWRRYAKHLPDCLGGLSGDKYPCTCGLEALLAAPARNPNLIPANAKKVGADTFAWQSAPPESESVSELIAAADTAPALELPLPIALRLLREAWDRMDRARKILTDGNPRPECSWGMLDTKLDRNALNAALSAAPQNPKDHVHLAGGSESADTRVEAKYAHRSTGRLVRLIELRAPAIIIENERRIALRRLTAMPVSPETAKAADEIEAMKEIN